MYRSLFKWLCFSTGILFLFTTCAEEIELDFPIASLSREVGLVYKDTTVCFGQEIKVKLRLNSGSANMKEFAIYETDRLSGETTLLPMNRVAINGGSSTINNPITLAGSDQTSVVYDITILPEDSSRFVNNYIFRVVDEMDQPTATSVFVRSTSPFSRLIRAPNKIFLGNTDNRSVFVGNPVRFRLAFTDCWQNLKQLEIYEDDLLLPSSQISVRLASDSSVVNFSNPFTFQGDDRRQFIYDIDIMPTEPVQDSTTRVYRFNLENELMQPGGSGYVILNVPTTSLTTNAIDSINGIQGTLYNQIFEGNNTTSAVGYGGLDLDTGESVDANSSDAEIQDEGTIVGRNGSVSWRQQISVVDSMDTQMRAANFLFDETFESITFEEKIIDIFNRSSELAVEQEFDEDPLPVSDTRQGEKVSSSMKTGDIFVLRRAGKYYLIKCTNVLPDLNGNKDLYEFKIKY